MTDFIFTVETTAANETFTIPHGGGTFSYTVSWGDGNSDTGVTSSPTHTYTTAGTYTITISGTFPSIKFNNGGDKLKVKTVQQLGNVGWTSFDKGFYGCSNMTSFTAGTGADTSSVTYMANMFYACSSLTSLDLDDFNTSSVTNMANMFYNCSSLTSVDASNFDTSSVTNMANMFRGCSSLTSVDASNFDTSSVTNMANMFYNCSSLTSIDVSSFNTSSVTSMSSMFYSCSSLTSLDLNNFDTSSVPSMASMFYGCSSLTSLDVSSFNTSSVTHMANMFRSCSSLTSLAVSNFDTSLVANMSSMFYSCTNLTGITIHGWNVESLTNGGNMFYSTNSAISTAEYDLILKNWSKQSLQSNVSIHFGDAQASTAVTSPKLTYGTTSNSTMVNSSGEIVWAPHNLALNSAAPATQTITVVSGADYTVEVTGTGSMALSGAGTGTATDGSPATITASTTSLTITLTGSLDTVAVYRSDLGGMAPVPGAATGFEYYVPTNGAAEYLPRVGHHVYDTATSTWVNEGLLLESEARTNLLTYSEDFTSSWSNPSAGLTLTGSQSSPSGSNTAYAAVPTTGSTGHRIGQSVSMTASATQTLSVFVKANGYSFVRLRMQGEGGDTGGVAGNTWAIFNLTSPAVSSEGGGVTSTSIEDFGDGWYRCSLTGTGTTTGTVNQQIYVLDQDYNIAHNNWAGNGTSGVYLWGAQSEVGSTPSSYIQTSANSVIRDAQTLTVPSSELGWDSSAVSLQMEGRITASDDAADIMTLAQWKEANTQRIDTIVRWNGAYQGNVNILAYNGSSPYSAYEGVGFHSVSDGVLSPYSIAWRHTSSTLQAASAGSAISTTGTPNNGVPDLSAADITIGTDFMGTISHFRQWNEDIGETGIEEATS